MHGNVESYGFCITVYHSARGTCSESGSGWAIDITDGEFSDSICLSIKVWMEIAILPFTVRVVDDYNENEEVIGKLQCR